MLGAGDYIGGSNTIIVNADQCAVWLWLPIIADGGFYKGDNSY